MLTEEQLSTIKQQLIENIKKSFPEDKKQFAISQIEEMNSEQLEEFLEKNNIKLSKEGGPNSCIFCSIAEGKIESYRVGENNDAVAVLEINPISKGHTIIIPKEHLPEGENSEETKKLISKIETSIKEKLKPKSITITNNNLFGHQTTNIIPNYENEEEIKLDSPKTSAKQEELKELQEILTKEEESEKEESNEKENSEEDKSEKKEELTPENIWLPIRIP